MSGHFTITRHAADTACGSHSASVGPDGTEIVTVLKVSLEQGKIDTVLIFGFTQRCIELANHFLHLLQPYSRYLKRVNHRGTSRTALGQQPRDHDNPAMVRDGHRGTGNAHKRDAKAYLCMHLRRLPLPEEDLRNIAITKPR